MTKMGSVYKVTDLPDKSKVYDIIGVKHENQIDM